MSRGKTVKFRLNEKFIFGNRRCMRCGKVLRRGELIICNDCKRRRIRL